MTSPAMQEPFNEQETFDVRAYLRPVWRRRWIILLIVVLATAATYVLAARQHNEYVASTDVYITVVDPATAIGAVAPTTPPTAQGMQDVATLFTAQAITAGVYQKLHMPLGSAGSVNVAPLTETSATSTETSFVVVTATSPSPTLAARLANTYVSVFLAARRSAEAAAAASDAAAAQSSMNALAPIPTNTAERQALVLSISQYRTIELDPNAGAQQIDVALPPTSPSSPKPARDALFAALVALLFAIGIAFGLELVDRRLVSVSALESIYGRPVFAALPYVADPTPIIDGEAVVPAQLVEALRGLRINLGIAGISGPPRTVLIASGSPGEGKSTVARDLALVYAEAGESVLLIDADLRRPSVAWLCGVEPELGLSHVLAGAASLASAALPVPLEHTPSGAANGRRRPSPRRSRAGAVSRVAVSDGSLDVLAHGEQVGNPVTLLSSPAMKGLLAAASKRYDVIIVDSAPLLPVTDTVPLLGVVDAILLVARVGMTTRDAAERVTTAIGRVPGANLVGIVANDIRDAFLNEGRGGYYGDYGGYGQRPDGRTRGSQTTVKAG
jgi:Mrp family chromosome partitioning ATPase/capsular polysaccharide biosynthesis protein